MASNRPAWGPRAGKILCIVELDLAPNLDCASYPLDAVLRMVIDFCARSVWTERSRLDPQPPAPKLLSDFSNFSELFGRREKQERDRWYRAVEVLPPTTLFTDPRNPGIRIHLGLPPEIADDVRQQFRQKWEELLVDVKQCGVGPFLDLYGKPCGMIGGGPPVKAEYPLSRWGPISMSRNLICTKNQQRPLGTG